MTMFWEFFTFELKFRFKSLSTYIYFAVWFAFSFLDDRQRELRPHRQLQRQGAAQRSLRQHLQRYRHQLLRHHRDRRDLWHLHPARFPARHHPDSLHQAHLEVRLPRRPLGRVFRRHRLRLLRPALRRVFRHARPLGRPRPHRSQPPLLVSAAVLLRSWSSRSSSSALSSSWSPPSRARSSSSTCRARRSSCSTSSASPSSAPRARWSISGPASSTPSASCTTTPSPATGPWWSATRCSTPGRLAAASSCTTACSGAPSAWLSLLALWKLFPMSVEALTTRSSGKRAALAREQELAAVAAAPQPGRGEAAHRTAGLRLRHNLGATRLAHPPAHRQHRAARSRSGASSS